MTDRQLIDSLCSNLCPACGRGKNARMTLCGGCYHGLPRELQKALYNRLGEGYSEAVDQALRMLGVTTPRLPKSRLSDENGARPAERAKADSQLTNSPGMEATDDGVRGVQAV